MPEKMVALVTGANTGLGKQVARELVDHGYLVVIGSRDLEAGRKSADDIGDGASVVQLDITNRESIAAAAEHMAAEFGRLDLLVNNAGIIQSGRYGSSEEITAASKASVASLDEVRAVFETNVFGAIAVTQAMLPLIRASRLAGSSMFRAGRVR